MQARGGANALWEWVRSRPPLRQLQVDMGEDVELPGSTVHAICSLARARPALDVLTVQAEQGGTFDEGLKIHW